MFQTQCIDHHVSEYVPQEDFSPATWQLTYFFMCPHLEASGAKMALSGSHAQILIRFHILGSAMPDILLHSVSVRSSPLAL
jgi:hypothetical protein